LCEFVGTVLGDVDGWEGGGEGEEDEVVEEIGVGGYYGWVKGVIGVWEEEVLPEGWVVVVCGVVGNRRLISVGEEVGERVEGWLGGGVGRRGDEGSCGGLDGRTYAEACEDSEKDDLGPCDAWDGLVG